jgi:hypothetical protein
MKILGQKLKKIAFYSIVCASVLSIPALSQAQFREPGGTGLPTAPIATIITNVMYWVLTMIGILAVLGFAIAGIMFLLSFGREEASERAKKALIYSILGVIVALLGLVVLRAVQNILGARTNF